MTNRQSYDILMVRKRDALKVQERIAGVAQLVEHFLAKEDVAGSSPVSRSNPHLLYSDGDVAKW